MSTMDTLDMWQCAFSGKFRYDEKAKVRVLVLQQEWCGPLVPYVFESKGTN